MSLSAEEVERYARHLVLPEVGGPGQAALKAARAVVIGAGGLGSPVLSYLAAAGVGTLVVVDDDTVALSNLQRQTLFGTDDLGLAKATCAARAIARLNPEVTVVPHQTRFEAATADLLAGAQVVLDGSDNAATRYALSDACFKVRVPLVSGAVNRFDGHVTTLTAHERRPDGTPWPTYRCLFPDPPPDAMVDECAVAGILGVVTGVIGTLMANEAIKLIVGVGEPLRGKLLMFDALTAGFQTIAYDWDAANPLSGQATLQAASLGADVG